MTDAEILKGCAIARRYDVGHCMCQTLCQWPWPKKLCGGSDVKICSVISAFRTATIPRQSKVAEAMQAIHDGATEIDMVINIGKALGNEWHICAG